MTSPVGLEFVDRQEAVFAQAFASKNLELTRPLYDPAVVYVSPTVRLFGWPREIRGIDDSLKFIALSIQSCEAIAYEAVERAVLPDGSGAFVRIHFDWSAAGQRLRSSYVVIYRYDVAGIVRQELYYDPSAALEVLAPGSPAE